MESGEQIRVIIVDDIAETRENIRKILQFEEDVVVVGVARTGNEALQVVKETKPDVVLMDINMPDMDGIAATDAIRKTIPYTQIVILSVQGDPNYMRRAMLAGARDFLTKPPSVDELISTVRRAGKMAQEERRKIPMPTPGGGVGAMPGMAPSLTIGKVIVLYSPKGGVGTTTLATNLAVTLQNDESPVVLLDGNLQYGDVAVFLNVQGKNSIIDLAPRADELDTEIVEGVLINHADSGVRILPAPPKPEYAESVSGDQFAKLIKFFRQIYSYVVIDTSSALTEVVLAAFDQSDLIILLISQDIPAIKDAHLFMDLTGALNIEKKRIAIVMNRFDKRIGITPEKVGENLKHEITAIIPEDQRTVLPSINRGVPFMLGNKAQPICKSYLSLAKIVRERLTEISE